MSAGEVLEHGVRSLSCTQVYLENY